MSNDLEHALTEAQAATTGLRWVLGGVVALVITTAGAVTTYQSLKGQVEGQDRYGTQWAREQVRRIDEANAKRDEVLTRLTEAATALRDDVREMRASARRE